MKKFFYRIFSGFLSLVFVFTCIVYSYAETVDYGDVDRSNIINSTDALMILEHAVGKNILAPSAFERADVNFDGNVDSNDALNVLLYSVGLITGFESDGVDLSDTVKRNISLILKEFENFGLPAEIVYDEKTSEYHVVDKNGVDTGLFGYSYSDKDKVFFTAEESWQRNFGFNEVYDDAAAVGFMTYNTFRVYFEYDGLEWLTQFWKGQYSYAFIGSEIGVYNRTKGSDSGSTHYKCADDDHKFYMTMDVYRQNPESKSEYEHVFTRSRSKTWWCTGFVPGTLAFAKINVPDEDGTATLKVDSRIEFYDEEMAQAFVEGLKKVKYLENNAALAGTKRSVTFTECSDEEEYKECASSNRFCICKNKYDGKYRDVRVCYR